ncbi:MAG: PorP/SprF family type IX secretion system membrane protein [Bacteroidia bacterium]
MKKKPFQPTLKLRLASLLLPMLLLLAGSCEAQDTHFSQFYMSPLTQNPALAGAQYEKEGYLNYRNQWSSVTTPFRTMAGSYDMHLKQKKSEKGFWAGGLNLYSDKAGEAQLSSFQLNLSGAYHIWLDEFNTLGAGVQLGFAQRSLGSTFSTGSQFNGMAYDPGLSVQESIGNSSVSYLDAGTGIVWNYNNNSGAIKVTDNHEMKFTFGAALFHPNQPSVSFYHAGDKLYLKYVVHGSALLSIPNTNIAFVPGFVYSMQGPSTEIYAGTLIRYKLKQDSKYTGRNKGTALSMGAYYRAGDAVSATLLLEYSNYAIGYSYDVNGSSLQSASHYRGGSEITLRFVSPNPFGN